MLHYGNLPALQRWPIGEALSNVNPLNTVKSSRIWYDNEGQIADRRLHRGQSVTA